MKKEKNKHECRCQHEEDNHDCQCHHEHDHCETKKEGKLEEKNQKEADEKDYDQLMNKYLLALADIKNASMMHEKEKAVIRKYYFQEILEKMLPLLDAFEMAFKNEAPNAEAQNYLSGFIFIYQLFQQTLLNENVSFIEPQVGDLFDHNIHYASEKIEVDDEAEAGKITKVYLKGYKLHDRVIRSSNVAVSVLKEKTGGN